MMAFEYYEVRPVIEECATCIAFENEEAWRKAQAEHRRIGDDFSAFWTIYGRYSVEGGSEVQAIGDFETKEDALAVLNAILAGPARARDVLDAGRMGREPDELNAVIRTASAMLEDMINQSSNSERL